MNNQFAPTRLPYGFRHGGRAMGVAGNSAASRVWKGVNTAAFSRLAGVCFRQPFFVHFENPSGQTSGAYFVFGRHRKPIPEYEQTVRQNISTDNIR